MSLRVAHASHLSWSMDSNSAHGRGVRHGPLVACSCSAYSSSRVSSVMPLEPSGGLLCDERESDGIERW